MNASRRSALNTALLAPLIAGAAFTPTSASDDPQRGTAGSASENRLVGAWTMRKATFNGKPFTPPAGGTILKLHTATHYVFLDFKEDGTLVDAVGGTYTLTAGTYRTMPAFGFSEHFTSIKGKQQVFDCRIEGSTWYHSGTLTSGFTLDEVWERIG